MRLSAFVLAARLEQVVALANERLRHMDAGRYLLEHSDARVSGGARSGLDLRVLDEGLVARVGPGDAPLAGEPLGPFLRARSDGDDLRLGVPGHRSGEVARDAARPDDPPADRGCRHRFLDVGHRHKVADGHVLG